MTDLSFFLLQPSAYHRGGSQPPVRRIVSDGQAAGGRPSFSEDADMSMVPLLAAMQNTSIFDPASPPAEWIRNIALLTFAITGFIFVVVEAVLLYCLLRFRRGSIAGTTEPPQVYGS